MYKCNECGKQFEKPLVKGDLEEDIAVCPFCDSEWIEEVVDEKVKNERKECSSHGHYSDDVCPGCLKNAAPDLLTACRMFAASPKKLEGDIIQVTMPRASMKVFSKAIAKTTCR